MHAVLDRVAHCFVDAISLRAQGNNVLIFERHLVAFSREEQINADVLPLHLSNILYIHPVCYWRVISTFQVGQIACCHPSVL